MSTLTPSQIEELAKKHKVFTYSIQRSDVSFGDRDMTSISSFVAAIEQLVLAKSEQADKARIAESELRAKLYAPVSETPSQPKKDTDAESRRKSIEDIVRNLECLERDAETSIRAFGEEWAADLATSTLGLLEEYSDTLRGLACWLAAGGFNSDGLIDPVTANAKIRWGVDYLTKSSQPTLAAPPHSEQQEPAASNFACVSGKCPDKRECNAARACLYATAPQPSQVQVLEAEIQRLRTALEQITRDCTARKAVMIARNTLQSQAKQSTGSEGL